MENLDLKKKFISKLEEKKINVVCPVCHQGEMLVEGPFAKALQNNPNMISIGGPSIPTFAVICKNCGNIREFALGSLGLLDDLKLQDKTPATD